MRYRVTLEPSSGTGPVTVAVLEQENGTLNALVDGRHVAVDAVALGEPIERPGRWGVVVDLTARGSLSGPRRGGEKSAGVCSWKATECASLLRPPRAPRIPRPFPRPLTMPGRVVRVPVQAGDAVRTGQTLVVLEAMKMENEVLAAHPGTVVEIHVTVGAAVDANAKLITLIATGH